MPEQNPNRQRPLLKVVLAFVPRAVLLVALVSARIFNQLLRQYEKGILPRLASLSQAVSRIERLFATVTRPHNGMFSIVADNASTYRVLRPPGPGAGRPLPDSLGNR